MPGCYLKNILNKKRKRKVKFIFGVRSKKLKIINYYINNNNLDIKVFLRTIFAQKENANIKIIKKGKF